jgi:hypothetical protein
LSGGYFFLFYLFLPSFNLSSYSSKNIFPLNQFCISGRETYIAGREIYIAGREMYIAGREIELFL